MSFFLAVDLDEPVRADVADMIALLRERHPAKWLLPDRLHATVLFLGRLTEAAHAEDAIITLAARHAPFQLTLDGSGLFATARAAAVVWLGLEPSPPLLALRRDAITALADLTVDDPVAHGYTPHVTLARAQRSGALDAACDALVTFRSAPFTVERLTLYESRGTHFRAVFQAPLAPPFLETR